MDATRARFGPVVEWLLAATLILAAIGVGSIGIRELRAVRAVLPLIAHEAASSDSLAGLPARAISVPLLLLGEGREVRIGDTASAVTSRLAGAAQVLSESVERANARERLTRFYEHVGGQFVLVFEAFEEAAEPRVAAIYLR